MPPIISSATTAATSHLTENGRDFCGGKGGGVNVGGVNVGARTLGGCGAKEASSANSSTKVLAFLKCCPGVSARLNTEFPCSDSPGIGTYVPIELPSLTPPSIS